MPERDKYGENFYGLIVTNIICEHCLHNEDYLNCKCENVMCLDRRETEKEKKRLHQETIKKKKKRS